MKKTENFKSYQDFFKNTEIGDLIYYKNKNYSNPNWFYIALVLKKENEHISYYIVYHSRSREFTNTTSSKEKYDIMYFANPTYEIKILK